MTIRKITVNENEYQFINNSRDTRTGFAHDTTLFINGVEIGRATSIYYNRTWEYYKYQTVMQKCISNVIDEKYERYIQNFKANNNIKRLTEKKRDEADRDFYNLKTVKELQEVYQRLDSSN